MNKPPHGTVQRYDLGCACARCREADIRHWGADGCDLDPAEAQRHARSHGIPEARLAGVHWARARR